MSAEGYVLVTPPPGLFEVNAEDEAKTGDTPASARASTAAASSAAAVSGDAGDNA